ncbi:NUDIX domain-containing protein [Ferrimonas lipolytica]|uniref:NUDIX domain-containing protein n=2 Tax=Ferrimonas lipolytica TaxID=2724191 RepID=A0A6H1UIB0_9GAMM|nr:NUDIX domain-containing protein [Ferrimonas lipolytica]
MRPSTTTQRPSLGVGIIVRRADGAILCGKRKGGHAPFWSIPGGHVEAGESFEAAAKRELQEETSLSVPEVKVIGLTNNLKTFALEGIHSVSVCVLADYTGGEVINTEPDKCDGWEWFLPTDLPQPHFDASEQSIHCLLSGNFYQPTA